MTVIEKNGCLPIGVSSFFCLDAVYCVHGTEQRPDHRNVRNRHRGGAANRQRNKRGGKQSDAGNADMQFHSDYTHSCHKIGVQQINEKRVDT